MSEELLKKLDSLLESYLYLLDQYQTERARLSKDLSSGYLFLARANFSPTGRTRYGQDYYDDRMQASRIVRSPHGNVETGGVKIEVVEVEDTSALNGESEHDVVSTNGLEKISDAEARKQGTDEKGRSRPKIVGGMIIGGEDEAELEDDLIALNLSLDETRPDQPDDPNDHDGSTPITAAHDTPAHESPSNTQKTPKHIPNPSRAQKNDPIHMFGVFVPPTLRQAQTSFVSAVVQGIPALIALDSNMKFLEIEIRRTRKALSKSG